MLQLLGISVSENEINKYEKKYYYDDVLVVSTGTISSSINPINYY